jgi:PEP-CTERM motif
VRSATVWEFKRGRIWPAVFALVALLAIPGRASATVLTYVPGAGVAANDLGDLDHHYYYAWTLGLISVPTNEVITSAYITFTNMYNWDASKNVLYLDMFDTPATGGSVLVGPNTGNNGIDTYTSTVRYAADPDVPSGSSPVTSMADAFDSANALTTNPKTDLTAHSFMADSGNPLNATEVNAFKTMLSTPDAAYNPTSLPQSYGTNATSGTTGWVVSAGATPGTYDYRYYFTTGTGSQLEALKGYIGPASDPNRDVTLAFDPDCHFFNDGVSFTIVTSPNAGGAAAVPEPASLMLLGTGMLFTAARYRRRRSNGPSK